MPPEPAPVKVHRRRDDRLVVRTPPARHAVALAPDGFDWPAAAPPRGQSAFLRLVVEASTRGKLVPPSIEAEAGGVSVRQYFERGAGGQRYVNLSPLCAPGGGGGAATRVALDGELLSWRADAELLLFEDPALAGKRVLVLAPHPDDAEIAAFGFYAGRSPSSWVATVTAGERGAAGIAAVVPPEEHPDAWKAHLRVWDSLAIPQLGDVEPERCLNLVYPDGRLAEMYRNPGERFLLACEDRLSRAALRARNRLPEFRAGAAGCAWRDVVDDLGHLCDVVRPEVIVAPHPIVDGHDDHRFTTVALDQALGAGGGDGITILLYVVHRRGWTRYPFGPRDAIVSLPPWTDDAWLADGIYSHALTSRVQRGKFFAIEAGHDARSLHEPDAAPLLRRSRETARDLSGFLSGLGYRSESHLRRASRPNELYYVVSRASLSALVARATGDPGPSARASLPDTADHTAG